MGGQACVFYGAAQVSKDVDLVLLAPVGVVLNGDGPAVRLKDGTADRQPQPQSALLCGVEGNEDLIQLCWRNANARVGDGDFDRAGVRSCCPDGNSTIRRGAGGHGIHGVDQQVEQDLLQVDAISSHVWQVGRDFKAHGGLVCGHVGNTSPLAQRIKDAVPRVTISRQCCWPTG